MKSKITVLIIFCSLLFFSQPVLAFDGTDSTPPTVLSMRQITNPPSNNSEIIAIEILTQDDKNWVKIGGTPQIGYSYRISNPNAAPNCATVSNSFSKFEVLEDLRFRSSTLNSNPKKQRFVMVALAPKPKSLPSNCPEYRNLSVAPAVALNSTSFTPVTNRTTKVTVQENNILAPAITDESGRTTAAAKNSLSASNLTYSNQSTGLTSQFCVPAVLRPQISLSLSAARDKYTTQVQKAVDAKVPVAQDPAVDIFESQIRAWDLVSSEPTIGNLNQLKTCLTSFTSQQVATAYQALTKKIELDISNAVKNKLLFECSILNDQIKKITDARQLLGTNIIQSVEYSDFLAKSRQLKPLVCDRATEKLISDTTNLISEPKLLLDTNLPFFLGEYCSVKDAKRDQYLQLKSAISLRYRGSAPLIKWSSETQTIQYQECDPTLPVKDLVTFEVSSNATVLSLNSLLTELQQLEKVRKVKITIICKSGNKTVRRSGNPPKCPSNFSEIRNPLNKIT